MHQRTVTIHYVSLAKEVAADLGMELKVFLRPQKPWLWLPMCFKRLSQLSTQTLFTLRRPTTSWLRATFWAMRLIR